MLPKGSVCIIQKGRESEENLFSGSVYALGFRAKRILQKSQEFEEKSRNGKSCKK